MRAAPTIVVILALAPSAWADAGVDAGATEDAGSSDLDAGDADAGLLDDDAGLLGDAGTIADDAGTIDDDAGTVADDAGQAVDAGDDPCAPRCEGDALVFCDDETGAELLVDCTILGGRCGLLATSWGMDCLLPADAPCEPGYAEGRSRCDPTLNLFCTDDRCSTELPGDEEPPVVPDTAGGIGGVSDDDQHPLWFLGCTNANSPSIPFFGLLFSTWILGRRGRRSSRDS